MGKKVEEKKGGETLDQLTKKIKVHETRLPSGKDVVLVDVPGDDTYSEVNNSLSHLQRWVDAHPR